MSTDIPKWAFIEQQVLARAARDGGLGGAARTVEAMYGLRTGFLGDGLLPVPRVLSLLYLLILFPKEYWKMGQRDPTFAEIGARWSLDGVRIVTQDERYGNTIYGFIHQLRNALAHANITFQGTDIEIWNCNSNGREVYRACIPLSTADEFLSAVGAIMANRRNLAVH